MTGSEKPSTASERVRRYRSRLNAQGLRPVQIWVPDTRSPEFTDEAHRQSEAVAASTLADIDQEFIDTLTLGLD